MRAFVALEVPSRILDAVAELQGELVKTGADIKLVERGNLHFTVKFLGEIGDQEAADAGSRLARLPLAGPTVDIRGVGAFPASQNARVVWVGAPGPGGAAVEQIASAVAGALEGIGERDAKPFRAHLTVARVRSGRNARLLAEFIDGNSDWSFGTASLKELKLKSSRLTPRGPVYADVGAYPLS